MFTMADRQDLGSTARPRLQTTHVFSLIKKNPANAPSSKHNILLKPRWDDKLPKTRLAKDSTLKQQITIHV